MIIQSVSNDPLGDFFESQGIKMVDCTPLPDDETTPSSNNELREKIIEVRNRSYLMSSFQQQEDVLVNGVIDLIQKAREEAEIEARITFANDMLEMNKWNERARTDELHKILRQELKKAKGEGK